MSHLRGGEEWLTPNVSLITDVNTIMYTPKGVNLSVTIASNQSNDTTITNVAQATIKYGSVTITAKNGDIVNVPKNNSIVVSFSQVEDYKTPDTQIFTTGTGDISVNGLYQTEVVNVNITAENGESLNGVVITINSKDYTYNGSTISVKVPFDVTYDVIFGSFSGLTKPQTLTYVASQVSRDVTGEYIEKPNELIAIYDVRTTSSSTYLLGSSFNISQVSKMWIDDVEVTPTTKYTFSTTGKHIVKILMSSSFNTCSYMFNGCSSLTSLDLSNFDTSSVKNMGMGGMFSVCKNLKSIKLGDKVANTKVSSSTFGNSSSYYTGYNSRSTGENKLYVPVGATGYDTGYWLDPLQNTSRCGFTIVYSL